MNEPQILMELAARTNLQNETHKLFDVLIDRENEETWLSFVHLIKQGMIDLTLDGRIRLTIGGYVFCQQQGFSFADVPVLI